MNYDLIRGLHIIAVVAWMAGLLYLPRLFAYHAKAQAGSPQDLTFQVMERKLFRIIMTPAMLLALGLGLALIWVRGGGDSGGAVAFLLLPWMIVKLGGVVFLIGWHYFLGRARRRFARGANNRSERFWRATNELPFIAAIVMILAVTTEFHF